MELPVLCVRLHVLRLTITPLLGAAVLTAMSFIDRFLAVWVLGAMVIGVLVGNFQPGIKVLVTITTSCNAQLRAASPAGRCLVTPRQPSHVCVMVEEAMHLHDGSIGWAALITLSGRH